MIATPEIKILPAYMAALEFIEAVQADPRADRQEAYQRIVVDPFWEQMVTGAEFARYVNREKISQPPQNLEKLAANITAIRESDVEVRVKETLQQLSKFLPGPDTTVCIAAGDPDDEFLSDYFGGVGGAVIGSGRIVLNLAPRPGWLEKIPAGIAHEYHHSVWLHRKWNTLPAFDLLNYLVFEGRACVFAQMLFPGAPAPWTEALTPEQEAEQWSHIREHLTETSFEKQAPFMFGSASIPLCTGYTIGFHIVQRFLQKNSPLTVEEWTLLDADDLLNRSEYDGA